MSVETWLAFVAASAVLLVISGPTVLLVLSYALGQGWRVALPVALGVVVEPMFLLLAFVNALGYALLGIRLRRLLSSARAVRGFDRTGGSLLIGAGIASVAVRPSH